MLGLHTECNVAAAEYKSLHRTCMTCVADLVLHKLPSRSWQPCLSSITAAAGRTPAAPFENCRPHGSHKEPCLYKRRHYAAWARTFRTASLESLINDCTTGAGLSCTVRSTAEVICAQRSNETTGCSASASCCTTPTTPEPLIPSVSPCHCTLGRSLVAERSLSHLPTARGNMYL